MGYKNSRQTFELHRERLAIKTWNQMLDNITSTEVQSMLQLLRLHNILQRRPAPFADLKMLFSKLLLS